MVYFPESSVITTVDGIQFKTFSNEHPPGFIIAKPKYIPLDEVFCESLQYRNLFNKDFNRLNLWSDKESLIYYLEAFLKSYPPYKLNSSYHQNWFFAIPHKKIKQILDPIKGIKTLMSTPEKERDNHLKKTIKFVELILQSKVSIDDLGITFSTLAGHYDPKYSDINLVIYGKNNAWKIIKFLEKAKHPSLKWKTNEDWEKFRLKRNRSKIFSKEEFIEQMSNKKTEGFFDGTLFLLFPVEKEDEVWSRWGEESYNPQGLVEIEGEVTDDYDSLVRPGRFKIKNSRVLKGKKVQVSQVVFYSRDYVCQASQGEKIKACGLLEEVKDKNNKTIYHRVVIGYFDSYINERREREYIKKIN